MHCAGDDVPLIWTSKGNLPLDSLTYATRWEETDSYLKFVETYSIEGEVVKESCHVYLKVGQQALGEQGGI